VTFAAIQFESPLSLGSAAVALLAAGALWLLFRLRAGPPVRMARRTALLALRASVLGLLALILAGPVRVEESPGAIRRPDVFVLLDASQSMSIGTKSTRWDDALAALAQAAGAIERPESADGLRLYRFGHRLTAVEAPPGSPTPPPPADSAVSARLAVVDPPADTDTRLGEALRQLTSRFGRTPPAAVVLFSDGRVRDAPSVEELARHYGQSGVPVHVYPVGDTASGGDIALVSIVAPKQVRKFSHVDVHVFLRSFGFEGRRTAVRLLSSDTGGGPPRELASVPITLKGGVQSVPLTFRSDVRPEHLQVVVPVEPDEISTRNNALTADVDIDRTKIRVLYVEGSHEPVRAELRGDQYEWTGPHSPIAEALTEDEDVECVTLVRTSPSGPLVRLQSLQNSTQVRGLPDTQAELAAFDAILLSNVSRSAFSDEQLAWIAHWVSSRGGGLCMLGGPASFASGGWAQSPLADLLPVEVGDERWSPGSEVALAETGLASTHAVWTILTDRQRNREILGSIPGFLGMNQGLVPKPSSNVLAAPSGEAGPDGPVLVCGAFGRGRTLAMSVPATSPWADEFLHHWGPTGNRYSAKFWRNVVYWITENSAIGRRRLVADVDKRFYRPGEAIRLSAVAYDEAAGRTTDYAVWGMIEPRTLDFDEESLYTSIRWPGGLPRESGEEGPHIAWGEEFELPRVSQSGEFVLPLEIADRLRSGDAQGVRIELTAFERTGGGFAGSRGTQVDSTSLEVQIVDDPFEQQNPFPNHDLLARAASLSGGRMLSSPSELAGIVDSLPVEQSPPVVRKAPLWSRWWLWTALMGLLSVEWFWRRGLGLA
jgi:uncharacterized membrane protein